MLLAGSPVPCRHGGINFLPLDADPLFRQLHRPGASGISEVNAAMMAQAVIMRYAPRAIVSSGVAGGVNPALHVGDVVVPDLWSQYQEQVLARMIPDGWDPSGSNDPINYPNYGMLFPLDTCVALPPDLADTEQCFFWFPVSPDLLEVASRVLPGITLKQCLEDGECLRDRPKDAIGGSAATGTSFLDNESYRAYLWDTFQAECVDRESGAVAQVGMVSGVPFIAIRAVSDLAGASPDSRQFARFADLAAENVSKVVSVFLGSLP